MKKFVVGIADMKVSNDTEALLITYSLGSCIGLSIYDPIARVAGLIHILLPESNIDQKNNTLNPYKYVDTGVPLLFKSAYKLGAVKNRLRIKIAGCAQISDSAGIFNIGKRNYAAIRKLLWKNDIMINSEHCGGRFSRNMSIEVKSGITQLKMAQEIIEI